MTLIKKSKIHFIIPKGINELQIYGLTKPTTVVYQGNRLLM